jgi:hypothetical protein
MSEMGFLHGLRLPDLGLGAGYAVFALRACAYGAGQCGHVRHTFCGAFGADGEGIRSDFDTFARLLGEAGQRAVTLAPPGTCRITADEISFVAAMAAAQSGEIEKLSAHLTWLFAGPYCFEAEHAVNRAAAGLYVNGVTVDAPVMDAPQTLATMTARPVHYSGYA